MARIALDAMGGDRAPEETIAGAIASIDRGVTPILVGDEPILRRLLDDVGIDLEVVHASEIISMGEDPGRAIREKKQSSVSVAARLVAAGDAAGMVSAGSTGAALAAAALIIGRIAGVQRPAIATMYPTPHGGIMVLDSGANIECRPEHLVQFAVMGSLLAEVYLDLPNPRVGLLNIGEEPGKGRDLEKQAFSQLEEAPVEFVGNVEGSDIASGRADVFVTDGFTGNVLLKGAEGMARFLSVMVMEAFADLVKGPGGAGIEATLDGLRHRIDPETYGGAHLVGAKGLVVIAHGSSSRVAIANALAMAAEGADRDLVSRIAAGVGT